MVDKIKDTQEHTTDKVNGTLTYEDKVIQKIVGLALSSVDGLLAIDGGFLSNLTGKIVNSGNMVSGVGVEVGKQQVAVDLKIVAEYKKSVPAIYENIKKEISKGVKEMTNLEVVEINVDVIDIKTKEQHKQDQQSLQDKVGNVAKTTGPMALGKDENSDEPRVK